MNPKLQVNCVYLSIIFKIIDVQPPVMSNCSKDMHILTSDLTKSVKWTIPDFTDPHNTSLLITKNYVINNWTFPWGDYNISYSALKPMNGLVTECLFEIKIRRKL